MNKDFVTLYDSTLRDGAQTPGVDLSLADKLAIAKVLDDFGIDYIEGGWSGSNPLDNEFFNNPPSLQTARLTSFGMTRRADVSAGQDRNLRLLDETKVETLCLVGKASSFQVETVLKVSYDDNLAMIEDSFSFLRERNKTRELLFDAEHFFDGFKKNEQYSMACLERAVLGGAGVLVLCDTNGGSMVDEIYAITEMVVQYFADGTSTIGIHAHDDTGQAVANSLAAVRAGARHVQGTLNGLGERCGNANLVTILPNLMLKMGMKTSLPEEKLRSLTALSTHIDDILNRSPAVRAPYVGEQAFAHKGGLHGSAISKDTSTYEHIHPEQVGNERQMIVSHQAGRALMRHRLQQCGIPLGKKEEAQLDELIEKVKSLEYQGYAYDGAWASFELVARRQFGSCPVFYEVPHYRVVDERRRDEKKDNGMVSSIATIEVLCKGETVKVSGDGNGPVNALDKCLRRALEDFFPSLKNLMLEDYKVRILNSDAHTEAQTRVRIGCTDEQGRHWATVGVSTNVIDASWQALNDAIQWKLIIDHPSS